MAGGLSSRGLPLCAAVLLAAAAAVNASAADGLKINQIQFIGSHNSYKKAMPAEAAAALRQANPEAARSLEYAHIPLAEQLDRGLRKLELDVFNHPDHFVVGHVQVIDMNSHCSPLAACLGEILVWSRAHPRHVPLWISFNAKDQPLPGLPDPLPFDADALRRLDRVVENVLGTRLIRPADTAGRNWPSLAEARGKFLLILDERGRKLDWYLQGWRQRPMFALAAEQHPAAAVMIINNPLQNHDEIQRLVRDGYLVRTRADADTLEARRGETARRDKALSSGAQAVSTDYYLPENPFGTDYRVSLPRGVRCNPVNTPPGCVITE